MTVPRFANKASKMSAPDPPTRAMHTHTNATITNQKPNDALKIPKSEETIERARPVTLTPKTVDLAFHGLGCRSNHTIIHHVLDIVVGHREDVVRTMDLAVFICAVVVVAPPGAEPLGPPGPRRAVVGFLPAAGSGASGRLYKCLARILRITMTTTHMLPYHVISFRKLDGGISETQNT